MTNPLIPYSFIPGTKAKASEVNANFTAVADAITNSKQYTIDQIASLDTKIQNSVENVENKIPKKDLTDTNYFTNCIIEAPNGIGDFNADSITLNKGLRVLIPDGRNEDGSLKNIDLTLEEDITFSSYIGVEKRQIFLNAKGEGETYKDVAVFYSLTAPVAYHTNSVWFNQRENKWYITNNSGTSWKECSLVYIGKITCNSTAITAIETAQPINFLKNTDVYQIIDWSQPDYASCINKPANTTLQAECNAVMIVYGGVNAMNVEICNIFIGYNKNNLKQITCSRTGAGANDRQTITIPVTKGIWYNVGGNAVLSIQFYPLKGETYA